MKSLKIMITNATSDAGLAVIRSVAKSGAEVVSVDHRRLPVGNRSRYARASWLLNHASQAELETDLLRVVEQERPDALLPIGSAATMAVCHQKERFSRITAVCVPDYSAFMSAYRKETCLAECRSIGIPCPREYSAQDAANLLESSPDATVLVVKPGVDVGAAQGVTYVHNATRLHREVDACCRLFGSAIIQDYIPGETDAMKTVFLFFSRPGHLSAAFTTQKTRQWPSSGGPTVASISTQEPELIAQVLPYFKRQAWLGAAEVELKFDTRDAQYKLLEINPRFPGYVRFAIHCGLDIAAIAVLSALGKQTLPCGELPEYAVGEKYLNPGLFLRSVGAQLRSRTHWGVVVRDAIRDMQGTAGVVTSMLADPLPLVGRVLAEARGWPGQPDH